MASAIGSPGLGLIFTDSAPLRAMCSGFGIDLQKVNGSDRLELAVPGTFVVDRNGIVRDTFVDPDYKKRMEPERIIAALAGLTRS